MANVLAQVVLKHRSGFAEDSVVNTFSIDTAGGVSVAGYGPQLAFALAGFWKNFSDPDNGPLSDILGAGIVRNVIDHDIKLYNATGKLDGVANLGSPIYTDKFSLVPGMADPVLPEEVAIAMTIRVANFSALQVEAQLDADPQVERPRQRGSGRLYLGPVNGSTVETDAAGRARVPQFWRDRIGRAAQRLQTQLTANGHQWCVWSRANSAMIPVATVQVDDAFDTQRRRGPRPGVRTSYAIS